jgi:hypothetical protein
MSARAGISGDTESRPIDFVAADIDHISASRIAENRHLDNNLTLLRQPGQIPE